VWFVTIGVLGLSQIIRQPGVLAAVSPYHAARFFAEDPRRGFVVLGAVFLVVTGGEALYADLGHFGHRAIQLAWFGVALPCLLVLGFHAADPQQPTSSNIAGAYGVALSTLMLITTLMFYVMSREVWRWSFARAAIVSGLFLCVDVPFFGANMLKISSGGWVPLAIAAAIFLLMTTWQRGREILGKRMQEKTVALKMLLADLAAEPPLRVP